MNSTNIPDYRKELDNAELLRKQEKFLDSIFILEPIWNSARDQMTKWNCWNFALCLKHAGRIDDALEVCRHTYKLDCDFRYNNNLYAWCIYELEVKGQKPENGSHIEQQTFEKAVNAIAKLTEQSTYSPFEHTIMAHIRYLKVTNQWDALLTWSAKLNPQLLNSEELTFEADNGRQVTKSPYIETWYASRTKALEKLERYQECLSSSREALDNLTTFHDGNEIWFNNRIGLSLMQLEEYDEAIEIFEKILKKQTKWFIQQSLAEAYFLKGEMKQALKHASGAALNGREEDKKYKLFLLLADITEKCENSEIAKQHVELAAAAYSKFETPRISTLLASYMDTYEIVDLPAISSRKLYNDLKWFWKKHKLADLPSETGQIMTLRSDRQFGFIRGDDGSNHYFKTRSLQGATESFQEGVSVKFHIKQSFDKMKQRDSTEAINITVLT